MNTYIAALAAADIGIAMGLGAPIAEAAFTALAGDDLRRLVDVRELGGRTPTPRPELRDVDRRERRACSPAQQGRQVLAAILHNASSVAVVTSSRLIRHRLDPATTA